MLSWAAVCLLHGDSDSDLRGEGEGLMGGINGERPRRGPPWRMGKRKPTMEPGCTRDEKGNGGPNHPAQPSDGKVRVGVHAMAMRRAQVGYATLECRLEELESS